MENDELLMETITLIERMSDDELTEILIRYRGTLSS